MAGFLDSVFDAVSELTLKTGIQIVWTFKTSWTGYKKTMGKYQYFSDEEVKGLDDKLCQMLSIARGKAGVPFLITCGFRTLAENSALTESVRDSAHLRGLAVDLACSDSQTRYLMLSGLLGAGFTRIGIYSAHLHADCDPSLPSNVIWYVSGT